MNSPARIPDEVRRFVLTSIPSVPYLEAALLFQRQPDVRWTAGEAAKALYIQEAHSMELLQGLCAAGIVACEDGTYWYAPEAPLDQALRRLAEAYLNDLVGVTNLIHDATQKSAHRFADAFRWRKDR